MKHLDPKTQQKYMSMATNFISKIEGKVTGQIIIDELLSRAPDMRPGSWRNLRNALKYQQAATGNQKTAQKLDKMPNPVTAGKTSDELKKTVKHKQRRVKNVSDSDMEQLLGQLDPKRKSDRRVGAAVLIARHLGCRPTEMTNIKYDAASGEFHITGAKGRAEGDRGLNRTIRVANAHVRTALVDAVNELAGVDMKGVRDRMSQVTKAMHPRRKHRATLYSFRHTMGSILKASKLPRTEIAYLMGHQSTASVDVYGDSRSAGGREPGIEAGHDADMSMIREMHEEPGVKRQSDDLGLGEDSLEDGIRPSIKKSTRTIEDEDLKPVSLGDRLGKLRAEKSRGKGLSR